MLKPHFRFRFLFTVELLNESLGLYAIIKTIKYIMKTMGNIAIESLEMGETSKLLEEKEIFCFSFCIFSQI